MAEIFQLFFPGILRQVQEEYQIDDGEAGALQTAFVICYMLFAPLFGYFGDRHSRKMIMAFGVLIWVIATLVGSFMPVKDYYLLSYWPVNLLTVGKAYLGCYSTEGLVH